MTAYDTNSFFYAGVIESSKLRKVTIDGKGRFHFTVKTSLIDDPTSSGTTSDIRTPRSSCRGHEGSVVGDEQPVAEVELVELANAGVAALPLA